MRHEERRIIKHTPSDLYNLVADVKKYPEFLPWCLGARIKNTTLKSFEADLLIGFKIYKEVYSSKIILDKKNGKLVRSTNIKTKFKSEKPFRLDDNRIFRYYS